MYFRGLAGGLFTLFVFQYVTMPHGNSTVAIDVVSYYGFRMHSPLWWIEAACAFLVGFIVFAYYKRLTGRSA